MKNIKYQKIIMAVVIGILIYPSVILASWWNPFSWFKKKFTPTPIIEVQQTSNPVEIISAPEPIVDTKSSPQTKTEATTPNPPAVQYPIQVIAPILPVQIPVTELLISNIQVTPYSNSARVDWQTNLDSESKILLEGHQYISERGVGKIHYAIVNNLESDLYYSGSITATSNNTWKSQQFSFTTKQKPLEITIENKSCLSGQCTIEWRTNYNTNSRIKILKNGSIVKSLNSPSEDAKNHMIQTNLSAGEYTFTIYASSESELVEISAELNVPAPPTPCNGVCA